MAVARSFVVCIAVIGFHLFYQNHALAVPQATWATPHLTPDEVLAIRLPDVRITSAKYYKANEKPLGPRTQNRIQVSHLDIRGVIGGSIQFELLLPDKWNNRFVMGGGGGFVGTLANQARYSINRGYATVGTDTGHRSASGLKAEWALNNLEARLNFAYLAVHRTAEVAKAIIHTYYGSAPKYSYFSGCSNGGRQAVIAAQRYPDDFDGIISAAPAVDLTSQWAAGVSNAQHFFPDPAKLDQPIISKAALDRLYAEVIRQCDHQDGVKDGILDDPRICRFDWSECNWLTPAQIRAIKSVYAGPMNGQIYPGLSIGSEDQWYQSKVGSFANTLAQEEAPNFDSRAGLLQLVGKLTLWGTVADAKGRSCRKGRHSIQNTVYSPTYDQARFVIADTRTASVKLHLAQEFSFTNCAVNRQVGRSRWY